jgi:hypothetical protein
VELKQIASASMQFAGKYEPIYGRGVPLLKQVHLNMVCMLQG